MGNVKITYNGSQISTQSVSGSANIYYLGNVIGACAEGETKTINCNGKYMQGNLAVGSKTLNCAYKLMNSNVVVTNENAALPYIVFSSSTSLTISALNNTLVCDGTIQYSRDKNTWTNWSGESVSAIIDSESKYKLYFRGIGNTYLATSSSDYTRFSISNSSSVDCDGNIMALLDYQNPSTTIPSSYCFYYLFRGASRLVSAPQLPATTLTSYCYTGMFYGCTSLATAPDLPATTLTQRCYNNMFRQCYALTVAPKISATSLDSYCCNNMFYQCTALHTLPKLNATTLMTQCYYAMFSGCSNVKLSTTQTSEYQYAYRIPTSGTGTTASNALASMFASTGGTFTGTPTINTTYYTDHEPI